MLHPVVSGVYCLFKDRSLVYVGRSRSAYARIDEHRTKGRDFDYATVMACPEHDAVWIEAALIAAMAPAQNRAGKATAPVQQIVVQQAEADASHVIYTPPEAVRIAQEYGIGSPALRAALKDGSLPSHYKHGRSGPKAPRYIRWPDLLKWCERVQAEIFPTADLSRSA